MKATHLGPHNELCCLQIYKYLKVFKSTRCGFQVTFGTMVLLLWVALWVEPQWVLSCIPSCMDFKVCQNVFRVI